METQVVIITTKKQLIECLDELNQKSIRHEPYLDAQDEILKREEVAEILNISLGTLNKWMQSGIVDYTKIGNKVLFSKKAVLEAVKAKSKKRKN